MTIITYFGPDGGSIRVRSMEAPPSVMAANNAGAGPGRKPPEPADLPPVPQTDVPLEDPDDPEDFPVIPPDISDPPRQTPESPVRLPGR